MKGKDIVSNKIIDDVRLKYKLHGYSSLTELEKIQLVLSYSEINSFPVIIWSIRIISRNSRASLRCMVTFISSGDGLELSDG